MRKGTKKGFINKFSLGSIPMSQRTLNSPTIKSRMFKKMPKYFGSIYKTKEMCYIRSIYRVCARVVMILFCSDNRSIKTSIKSINPTHIMNLILRHLCSTNLIHWNAHQIVHISFDKYFNRQSKRINGWTYLHNIKINMGELSFLCSQFTILSNCKVRSELCLVYLIWSIDHKEV